MMIIIIIIFMRRAITHLYTFNDNYQYNYKNDKIKKNELPLESTTTTPPGVVK